MWGSYVHIREMIKIRKISRGDVYMVEIENTFSIAPRASIAVRMYNVKEPLSNPNTKQYQIRFFIRFALRDSKSAIFQI